MTNEELSDNDLMVLTAIVREADQVFQRVGGSSRHWVRDCFWPILQRDGLTLSRRWDVSAADEVLMALKGVVRVSDRNTPEFDAAKAAIAKVEAGWTEAKISVKV